jgi:Uma2 family endonuclease
MSQVAKAKRRLSVAEYFEIEEASATRHELVGGALYAMVGATDRHNLINTNLTGLLWAQRPSRCQVFAATMKLRIVFNADETYYYPDCLVSCAQDDRAPLYREKPILLAEIASPSTERIDRGEKFQAYTMLPSLEEYLLIQQDIPQVEVFRRGHAWRGETFFLEDSIDVESLGLTLALADLYRDVTF